MASMYMQLEIAIFAMPCIEDGIVLNKAGLFSNSPE
jgi:hypothetical protein